MQAPGEAGSIDGGAMRRLGLIKTSPGPCAHTVPGSFKQGSGWKGWGGSGAELRLRRGSLLAAGDQPHRPRGSVPAPSASPASYRSEANRWDFCIFFFFFFNISFRRRAKSTKIAMNRFLDIKFRWVVFAWLLMPGIYRSHFHHPITRMISRPAPRRRNKLPNKSSA